MSQLSPLLRDAEDSMLLFWCPGCDGAHGIRHGSGAGPRWAWNGDANKPTFSPSILVQGVVPLTDEQVADYQSGKPLGEPVPMVCHSFVNDGMIQFLNDCTHALAGQTVPLGTWD